MCPDLSKGCDYVYMPIEQERWCVALPFQARDKIGAVWVFGEEGSLEASPGQQAVDISYTISFVARRVGGVEADEALQYFNWTLVDGSAAARMLRHGVLLFVLSGTAYTTRVVVCQGRWMCAEGDPAGRPCTWAKKHRLVMKGQGL
jgi:hypothetical protein